MNLDTLPSDIIRKLIRLELNSIDNMRLISPLWSALVLDHLNNRKHLPIIEFVRWSMQVDKGDIQCMLIPMAFRCYFGASKWKSHVSNGSLEWMINENVKNYCPDKILTRIFQRCSRIKKLHITMISGQFDTPKNSVSRALSGDTIIEELWISNAEYFHTSILSSILYAVKSGLVQRIVLSPSPVYLGNIINVCYNPRFNAHNEFVLDVAKCLGRIDMTSTVTQHGLPYYHNYWDHIRTKLSAHFKIDVTKEIEPTSATELLVRFVLKTQ